VGDYVLFDPPASLGGEPSPRRNSRTGSQGRRVAPARSGAGTLAALGVGLLSLAVFASLALLVVFPLATVRNFRLEGAVNLGVAEARAWSGLPARPRWFAVDADAVAASVAANPLVAEARAEKRFPDTVTVTVRERVPLAVVYARGPSGRMEAHCVDGEGVLFAPASAFGGANGLPVLSGIEIRGLRYGLRLEAPFTGLLRSMAELAATEPALLSALSEIRVVSRPGAPAELVVYPAQYRLPVRMMPDLDAGLLKSMMLVLDVVEGKGLSSSIRELDFRTDTFIYRTKEAVSG